MENTAQLATPTSEIKGIGGWLILPAIGFVLGPLLAVGDIGRLQDIPDQILQRSSAVSRTNGEAQGRAQAIQRIVNQASVIAGIQIACTVIAAIIFFRKKRYFPEVFVGLIVVLVVLDVSIACVLKFSQEDACSSLVRPILSGAIWGPYFFLSKRARATFVN
jgi:hypothetical protein